MVVERWGTLSVKDHLNAQALVVDLLLYDRLVFPVISGAGERTRWRGENWDPDLQEGLIEELGTDLAVKADWDEARRQRYQDLRRARKEIAEDAFQTTRMVLAMDRDLPRPPGTEVRAVAAYHDLEEGTKELEITPHQPDEEALGKLAFIIGQRLLVPLIGAEKPRDVVPQVAEFSRSAKYREQRDPFYAWQESTVDAIVRGRKTIEGAVSEMQGYIKQLNESITGHWKQFAATTVFTVVGVGLPFALGIEKLALVAAIPGAFELVKFAALDVKEPPNEGKCEVAAMLVSARKTLTN
jgi:hypothetical protein